MGNGQNGVKTLVFLKSSDKCQFLFKEIVTENQTYGQFNSGIEVDS